MITLKKYEFIEIQVKDDLDTCANNSFYKSTA